MLDGKPLLNLPPKRIHVVRCPFTPPERAFYDAIEAKSLQTFQDMAEAGKVNQFKALTILLRSRQGAHGQRLDTFIR